MNLARLHYKAVFFVLALASWTVGIAGVPLRVGGTYLVKQISPKDDGSIHIRFESTSKTGKFDVLDLVTDHVHYAVKEGSTTRLSAEIIETRGAAATVSQVMIFLSLPNQQSATVWLLSRTHPPKDLSGAKYLDQHSPTTDYLVL